MTGGNTPVYGGAMHRKHGALKWDLIPLKTRSGPAPQCSHRGGCSLQTSSVSPNPDRSTYRRLFTNRTWVFLLGGNTVSGVGDAFFNLAVIWIIYAASHSLLQTALIQVVWHLDRVLLGPIAGTVADRRNRTHVLLAMNLGSAIVTATVAIVFHFIHLSVAIALVAVFILNTGKTFGSPAAYSVMPDIVPPDLLATASGLMNTVGNAASVAGSALAGLVIAAVGGAGAIMGDAVSFLCAALGISLARLPQRTIERTSTASHFRQDLMEGWQTIRDTPLLRAMTILGMALNISSGVGPLYVALIRVHFQQGAGAFGVFEAMTTVGVLISGPLIGRVERWVGAGRLFALAWVVAGLATLAITQTTTIALADGFAVILGVGMTLGSIAMGTVTQLLVPDDLRGRYWGFQSATAVSVIPISALVAGWLGDHIGAAPVIAGAGGWLAAVGLASALVPTVRQTTLPRSSADA